MRVMLTLRRMHHALLDLARKDGEPYPGSDQDPDRFALVAPYVIEFEHNRVTFAAIDTRMALQIFEHIALIARAIQPLIALAMAQIPRAVLGIVFARINHETLPANV